LSTELQRYAKIYCSSLRKRSRVVNKNSPYLSLAEAMEVAERDKAKLVETPGFYSEFPKVIAGEREDLIIKVKILCEQRAFRVILPYTDQELRNYEINYILLLTFRRFEQKEVYFVPFQNNLQERFGKPNLSAVRILLCS